MGEFVTTLLAAVAQLEGQNIAERTRFALAHARSEGRVYGRIPFGFKRVGSKLVPDPVAMKGLTRARKLRAEGKTLKDIGAILEQGGYIAPQGGHWKPGSVSAILNSVIAKEQVA